MLSTRVSASDLAASISSTGMPIASASSSRLGARPSVPVSWSVISDSWRARRRAPRETQSMPRSSSMSAPLIRSAAYRAKGTPVDSS